MWGPTSKLIDYMVETERCYWKERSTTKQNCHQLVSGYRMFLSTALMPLTYIGTTILMYPLFRMLSISSFWLPGAVALLPLPYNSYKLKKAILKSRDVYICD